MIVFPLVEDHETQVGFEVIHWGNMNCSTKNYNVRVGNTFREVNWGFLQINFLAWNHGKDINDSTDLKGFLSSSFNNYDNVIGKKQVGNLNIASMA